MSIETMQPELEGLSKRHLLEGQTPETLIGLRDEMLSRLSDLERDIHLVNDVLGGMGIE